MASECRAADDLRTKHVIKVSEEKTLCQYEPPRGGLTKPLQRPTASSTSSRDSLSRFSVSTPTPAQVLMILNINHQGSCFALLPDQPTWQEDEQSCDDCRAEHRIARLYCQQRQVPIPWTSKACNPQLSAGFTMVILSVTVPE